MYKVEMASRKDAEGIRKIIWSAFYRSMSLDQFELPENILEPGLSRSLIIRDGEEIVSHIAIFSYENCIRGANLPFAGIGAVATDPLYRNKGMAKTLMIEGFKDMREHKEVISVLHPFDMEFYEKFGYATAEELIRFNIEAKNFRNVKMPEGITVRELTDPKEATKLLEIQKTMARFGSRVFHRIRELKEFIESPNCYLFERDKEPVGWVKFFLYRHDPHRELCVINFYAYKDDEALRAIVHLIRIYAIQYDITTEFFYTGLPIVWEGTKKIPIQAFVKDRFALRAKHVGGFMIRIVDFKRFCELIKIPKEATNTVVLRIEDRFCPWNNGSWKLQPTNGKLVIEKTAETPSAVMNDLLLSRLVSGLTPATMLRTVGLLDCSQETAEHLEAIFPEDDFWVLDREL